MLGWIKRNPAVMAVIVVLVAVIIVATNSRSRGELPIRVENPKREDILHLISTNGKVEPQNNFEAHAPTPTTVKRVLVKEGQKVKPGQLLVELDSAAARAELARSLAQLRSAQADLNAIEKGGTHEEVLTNRSNLVKAQAELDAARRNLAAVQNLRQKGAASEGELEAAQNRVNTAQADLQLLKEKQTGRYSTPEVERAQSQVQQAQAAYSASKELLDELNIRSPRTGTVYSVPVHQGQFVNQGDLIVQVADLEKMQVRAFVDEPEIGRLDFGQKAEVTWDALAGRMWQGVVTRVPTTVTTRGTRTVGEVLISVDNQDRKLLPNVNVSVSIVTSKAQNALTVSREAVVQEDGSRFLFVVEDNHLHRRKVETGIANLTRIQITGGVDENATVALGAVNSQPLTDGAPVKIVER
jgi:HlyD family secretion protein